MKSSVALVALAAASLLATAPVLAQSPPAAAAAPAAAASAPTVKPELAKPLQAAQAALSPRIWAEALIHLAEAEKVPDPGAYGLYVITRFRAQAALGQSNLEVAAASLESALGSEFMRASDATSLQGVLARVRINLKQYPQAVAAIQRFQALGGQDAELASNLPRLHYLAGDPAAAARAGQAEIEVDRKAGQPPREPTLRLLAGIAQDRKDAAGYMQALELLAEFHPKPEYWEELADRAVRSPGFSDRLLVEALRFKRAAGVLNRPDDYLDLAQMALNGGQPGEADKVIAEGFAAGAMGKGSTAPEQARLRDQAARAAANDKASFADGERSAPAARDGDPLINLGYAMAMDGQAARGVALVELGLGKSSLRRPDESRLRAGVVLWMAGRRDDAAKTLAQVKGTEGTETLARLWALYLRSPASQRKVG